MNRFGVTIRVRLSGQKSGFDEIGCRRTMTSDFQIFKTSFPMLDFPLCSTTHHIFLNFRPMLHKHVRTIHVSPACLKAKNVSVIALDTVSGSKNKTKVS